MSFFLASVADAQILYKMNHRMYRMATCKTLTESTLTFQSTTEEIRAGRGGVLCGRFAHSSGINIELTNVMFDMDMIAWQVGEQVRHGGIVSFEDEAAQIFTEGFYLTKVPQPMYDCGPLKKQMIWYSYFDCTHKRELGIEVVYDANKQLWVPVNGQSLESLMSSANTYITFSSNMGVTSIDIEGLQIERDEQLIRLNGHLSYPDEVGHSRATVVLDQQYLSAGQYIIDINNISTPLHNVYLYIHSANGMYEQFREISNETREVFNLPVDGLVYFELIVPNNTEFNNNSFEVHIEQKISNWKIQYLTDNASARSVHIGAQLFPKELILILTTQLFSGDSEKPEEGQLIGNITIKIPRFSLNGSFDLSMNMSEVTLAKLAGTALVDKNSEAYAEIVEFTSCSQGKYEQLIIADADEWEDADNFIQGEQFTVYGVRLDGGVEVVNNEELLFTPMQYFDTKGTILYTPKTEEFPIRVIVREKSKLSNYDMVIVGDNT